MVFLRVLSLFLFLTGFFHLLPVVCLAQEYSLEDLYKIVLERSERIKISEEDVYIAERGKDKAMSALLPKLTAFSSYTRYSEDKHTATGQVIQPDYSTSWGIRLEQSLSLSGREFTAFDISRNNIEKTKYNLHVIKEAYIFNVASAYYDVLKSKKALDVANANLTRLKKHRDAVAVRLKIGEVTKTDMLRAEAEVSGAQAELVKAENNLKLSKTVLARIVGLSGEFEIKELFADETGYSNLITADCQLLIVDCLKQKAFTERAEIKSSEIQKKIANEQVKYAKGAFLPALSIEGVYSGKEERPSSPFLNKESIYGGIRLNFPFFEGGLRKADVSEAEARQRQAEYIHDELIKNISIEVESAYLDVLTQAGILKSLEDRFTFATDNYNSVSRQYQFGLANSIDVIDANTLLLISEKQLVEAKYNYQLSVLRLQKATGTFLKTIISNMKM